MIGHGTVLPAAIASALARHVRTEMPMPFGRLFDEQPSVSLEDLDLLEDFLFEQAGQPDLDSAVTPAGFTFFGQFIDHDVTLTESVSGLEDDLTAIRSASGFVNLRTPDLELDSVFGFGPEHPISKVLFKADGSMLTGADTGHAPWDLPRQMDGTAVIADPRNDENKIIAQIHAAFIRAYNRLLAETGSYAEARIELYTTYQYIVLNDYLKRFVDPALVDEVKAAGAPFYSAMIAGANRLIMPLEFSVGAFRFGHSQVRPGYRLNRGAGAAFPLFNDAGNDLSGRQPILENARIDFTLFFDDRLTPGGAPGVAVPDGFNRTRRIDTRLAGPLALLRSPAIGAPPGQNPPDTLKSPRSLAKRNLFRTRQLSVVSGQRAATLFGLPPLSATELGIAHLPASLQMKTPLWYYVLREAELGGGERLGPVGGRILAETFIGALLHARNSFWRLKGENWVPPDGRRTMAQLMAFAQQGLPPPPQG